MKLLILAAALLASSVAQAESFNLLLSGSGVTLVDGNVTSAPLGANVAFGWAGSLHIETDGNSDGVYSGTHLTSFASRGAIDGAVPYAVFGFEFAGNGTGYGDASYALLALPTVTLNHGRVSAVTGTLQLLPTSAALAFAGMSVTENGHFWHQGTTYSTGMIQSPHPDYYCPPPVSPVPEPETYAMMLAGLAALRFRSGFRARWKQIISHA